MPDVWQVRQSAGWKKVAQATRKSETARTELGSGVSSWRSTGCGRGGAAVGRGTWLVEGLFPPLVTSTGGVSQAWAPLPSFALDWETFVLTQAPA